MKSENKASGGAKGSQKQSKFISIVLCFIEEIKMRKEGNTLKTVFLVEANRRNIRCLQSNTKKEKGREGKRGKEEKNTSEIISKTEE